MKSDSPAVLRRGAIGLLTLAAPVAVIAQTVPYDPNCKPIAQTEAQEIVDEFCASHAGCRFFVMAPINVTCKTVNFFRNLGTAISPSGEIRNEDVIDAATNDFPSRSTGQRIIDNAKNAASQASGAIGKLISTSSGEIVYEETVDVGGGQKAGSIIASSGQMARGTFDSNYRLQGRGQLIAPDGTMRAGEFRNNQLNGEGIVSERDGNRTVLIEGTFDGDTPVGEVIRNYADGSRVRELWENGKMVARGDRAPKGKVPPPIRRPEVNLASGPSNSNGEGWFLVKEGQASKKWELRCRGRPAVLKVSSEKPTVPSCKEPVQEAARADGSDFRGGDLIERTLGPSKTKAVGGDSEIFNLPNNGGQIYLIIRADAIEVVSVRAKDARYYAILEQLRTIPSVSPGTYRAPLPNGEFLQLHVRPDRWGKRIDVDSYGLGPASEQWIIAQ